MIQGLISLNRAQSLLQRAIRRNPQLYINAGFDPRAIDKFLRLPRFLKSPAMLDQRMEFYLNHPEFMHILGEEPSRIIPRYFMLERERFNPANGQEWRDLHQDMFDFMRSNYFLASAVPPVAAAPVVYRQMMDNDPGNTGMGRYMQNTMQT